MIKTAVITISLALLTIASPFAAKTAIAEEDLASVMADRDHLRDRLRRAIAISKERGAKLEAAEAGRREATNSQNSKQLNRDKEPWRAD